MPLNNSGVLALAFALSGYGVSNGNAKAQFIATPLIDAQQTVATPIASQSDTPRAAPSAPRIHDQVPPPGDLPQGTGPRGTSGQERYDSVGYAGSYDGAGSVQLAPTAVTVAHPSLPIGSYVELTALDSGRTIVALIAARSTDGGIVDLSPGAAQQLGINDGGAVRVRVVTPTLQDQAALRSGQMASQRIDAPPALLTALRRKLPARGVAATPTQPTRPGATRPVVVPPPEAPRPTVSRPGASYPPPGASASPVTKAPPLAKALPAAKPPVARVRSGFLVQVGAFSTRERAQGVARQVGGQIEVAGRFFRVQIGPFANSAGAQRARDGVARRGYGDARILRTE